MTVVGTGTEVGKTWVSCTLLNLARRRGLKVAARKPVQSFGGPPGAAAEATDAELLAAASGEEAVSVCPSERSYPVPMAPPMAAAALGLSAPPLASLVESVMASWPAGCDLGLVEGAGGVASPVADDGDCAALARAVGTDRAVLVADPSLGVINSVRLSVAALAPIPVVVHVNRYDPGDDLHRRNVAWLCQRDGLAVTTDVESLFYALVGP